MFEPITGDLNLLADVNFTHLCETKRNRTLPRKQTTISSVFYLRNTIAEVIMHNSSKSLLIHCY